MKTRGQIVLEKALQHADPFLRVIHAEGRNIAFGNDRVHVPSSFADVKLISIEIILPRHL